VSKAGKIVGPTAEGEGSQGSFTQYHQVSDGETWQEYLAAHLGEPVGDFGIGLDTGVYYCPTMGVKPSPSGENFS
jgi:hypothetical protein